jgi:hypothetical protein
MRFQTQVERVLAKVTVLERPLVLKQVIVHTPERALSTRGFGRRRRCTGMRMNRLEWEMAENKSQCIAILALQRVHAGARHAGIRTLVITVLEQRHLRTG